DLAAHRRIEDAPLLGHEPAVHLGPLRQRHQDEQEREQDHHADEDAQPGARLQAALKLRQRAREPLQRQTLQRERGAERRRDVAQSEAAMNLGSECFELWPDLLLILLLPPLALLPEGADEAGKLGRQAREEAFVLPFVIGRQEDFEQTGELVIYLNWRQDQR